MERRNAYEKQLYKSIEDIAHKHQLTYTITEDTNSEPRYCANWIKEIIHDECNKIKP